MGDQLLPTVIHDDDLPGITAHHAACRRLALGEERQHYYRLWSKSLKLKHYRSIDRCTQVGADGQCEIIEGQAKCLTKTEFDARMLNERALHHDLFTLHYQPIVHLATGTVAGHEALARIQSGEQVIQPGRFLPYLLGSDLERPWLQVQLDQVQTALTSPGFVSFNLSGSALSWPTFDEMLKPYTPNPKLWFEVLEDATIGEHQIENLRFIRRLGHKVELDDFPTGKDPVGKMLRSAAMFDAVKLDRCVCHGVADDPDLLDFATSLIRWAKRKKLVIICEGIERRIDADVLLKLGADLGQGWLYGKPSAKQFGLSGGL